MHQTIGVYEAKSKFSSLVHQVKKGHSFTITVRGKEVAELNAVVPPANKIKAALNDLASLRKQLNLSCDLQFIQDAKALGRR